MCNVQLGEHSQWHCTDFVRWQNDRAYCGGHFTVYTEVRPLHCSLETNIVDHTCWRWRLKLRMIWKKSKLVFKKNQRSSVVKKNGIFRRIMHLESFRTVNTEWLLLIILIPHEIEEIAHDFVFFTGWWWYWIILTCLTLYVSEVGLFRVW